MRRDLQIHACEMGGFMVYGPEQGGAAFVRNEMLRSLKACSHLKEATDLIVEQMGTARQQDASQLRPGQMTLKD